MLGVSTTEAMLRMHARAAGRPLLAIRTSTEAVHDVHLDSDVFEEGQMSQLQIEKILTTNKVVKTK